MNQRLTFGKLEKAISAAEIDRNAIATFRRLVPEFVDESIQPILGVQGWLSREERDRVKDVILATAWTESLNDFMRAPALRDMHRTPIGVWTELTVVPGEGLFGKAVIFDTAPGRDTALLVRAGVLAHFSVGWNPVENNGIAADGSVTWTKTQLVEGSIVDAPASLESAIERVVAYAKAHDIKLETYSTEPIRIVEIKEMEITKQQLDDTNASLAELKKETLGEFQKFTSQLKSYNDTGEKTKAEILGLVDRMEKDVQAKFDGLQKEIIAAKQNRSVPVSSAFEGANLKTLLAADPREIKQVYSEADASRVLAFQKACDDLLILDAILETSSRNTGGNYHIQSRAERVKNLDTFKRMQTLRKAVDTQTTTEGLEWVTPAALSGAFEQKVRLAQIVAPLFREVAMPTQSYQIDVIGAPTIAEYVSEQTTVSAWGNDTNEQTPPSAKMTLTAKKLRSRYQISTEMVEDSAVPILAFAADDMSFAIARGIDRAIINGDTSTTSFDTGENFGARDARRAWKGLRYLTRALGSTIYVPGTTWGIDAIRACRANMGKYGVVPSELALLVSLKGYLIRLLSKTEMPDIQTIDKYGPQAVVVTGELAKVDGIPIILSEFCQDNLNSTGIYDGSTTNRTAMILAHRRSFIRGQRRAIEVLVERDILLDVYQCVALFRGDFQPVTTPAAADVNANLIVDIATA